MHPLQAVQWMQSPQAYIRPIFMRQKCRCMLSSTVSTCGGFIIVRRFSPVNSGLFSRKMPNTRSACRPLNHRSTGAQCSVARKACKLYRMSHTELCKLCWAPMPCLVSSESLRLAGIAGLQVADMLASPNTYTVFCPVHAADSHRSIALGPHQEAPHTHSPCPTHPRAVHCHW